MSPAAYGPDPDRRCSGFNRIRRPGYMHGMLDRELARLVFLARRAGLDRTGGLG